MALSGLIRVIVGITARPRFNRTACLTSRHGRCGLCRDCDAGFDSLPDPRAHDHVHCLGAIPLITIMAVTCGADN